MDGDGKPRCGWVGDDALMLRYHDEEWGIPVHDDGKWFEFLILDAFQAGLSWKTVLHKREAFGQVFHQFDPQKVAHMTATAMAKARQNPAIIRNRLKIESTVKNAQAFLDLQEAYGSFDAYIWSFTEGRVLHNQWKTHEQIPVNTKLSDHVSQSLKSLGFAFVGSTICYSFLQAGGIVNDHLVSCFRYGELVNSTI